MMALVLKNINFGNICGASGVQGSLGRGYWFHDIIEGIGLLSFEGMTFVDKTMTAFPNLGNMPYDSRTLRPKELFPKCIVVNRKYEVMLNAVGLSSPGCQDIFDRGELQVRRDPHMLSFMAIAKDLAGRRNEARHFAQVLAWHLGNFKAPIALQRNYSCPNVGLDPSSLMDEVGEDLEVFAPLKIPVIPKFNVMVSPKVVAEIAKDKNCAAVCMTNTLPWKDIPEKWKMKFFGSTTSPLKKFGGGGLSGAPLKPMLARWLMEAEDVGISKQIIAGGGIMSASDAAELLRFRDVAAVAIGSVVSIHPQRVKGIIRTANSFGYEFH